jgi:predicted nucleic acid-binding protein
VIGFLLDTNVLSELRKGPHADESVRNWDAATRGEPRFTSVIVVGELRKGAHTRWQKDRDAGTAINRWIDRVVASFEDRVLPVDLPTIEVWANLVASRSGPPMDMLIAATAVSRGLTLVTRNVRDFAESRAALVNPWIDDRA